MTGKASNHLPYDLENMSVPELEALLQQDFLASDGCSPDVDFIMEIVEVMHKKEQAQPDYQPLDSAKAWKEFESFYIMGDGLTTSIYRSDEEPEKTFCSEPAKQALPHKKSKLFHRLLLIAASLCLLIALTCVPVFGYQNIFQMFARWTSEQFGFYMPPKERSASEQVPEEFEELQEIMQQLGAELIVPQFPEGFEPSDPTLDYFHDNNTLKFSIMYQRESEYYIFSVYQNEKLIFNQYEKSDALVETKVYNGIKYYHLENSGNQTVAWCVGTIEYYLTTNTTICNLEEILESMYNE